MAQWYVKAKGNRMEVQQILGETVDLPESVLNYFQNASAYYTEATQLSFFSEGSLTEEGIVTFSNIQLKVLGEETLKEIQESQLTATPQEG